MRHGETRSRTAVRTSDSGAATPGIPDGLKPVPDRERTLLALNQPHVPTSLDRRSSMLSRRPWHSLTALAALAVCLLIAPARADDGDGKRFNLVPFAGWTRFDRELKDNSPYILDDIYLGGRFSARLHSALWLDLAGGVTETVTPTEKLKWSHLSANLMLTSPASRGVHPFVSLGGGVSQFRPQITADKHDGLLEAAGGLRIGITDAIGIRLEARNALLLPKDHYRKAHIDNMMFGAGLSFGFGGGKAKDSDGDGVRDSRDHCPDTPLGCTVDEHGCPSDADGDGVCDGVDRCPNTPKGVKVDSRGCPMDDDGDGVFNGIDQCPDTPKGCTVDARGCPIDSDNDGVCDGLDQCPNTTTGCTVDAKGCTTDSDGDGVCDGLDKCSDTPAGARVDADGCPLTEVKQREMELLDTGMIRLKDIHFDTAKADILPESRPRIDAVGEVLSKWPQLKIEIGGYCDSRGSDAYNLALSNRRTASVRKYLLEHYPKLVGSQLSAKGYGESNPLVPNTSPENMAQNRRVEFVVLNKDVLKQLKR